MSSIETAQQQQQQQQQHQQQLPPTSLGFGGSSRPITSGVPTSRHHISFHHMNRIVSIVYNVYIYIYTYKYGYEYSVESHSFT